MPRVWNRRDPNVPKDAAYVGRPTRWGNPYSHRKGKGTYLVESRAEAVRSFAAMVAANPDFMRSIKKELRGKDLVCWCAPEACHADVLLEVANR